MAKSKLVGLLFAAWSDLDRVLDGLDDSEAIRSGDDGSSFAWTVAHLSNHVDTYINVRIQGRRAHELIGQKHFGTGGTGVAEDWASIQAAAQEVRQTARAYLEGMDDGEVLGVRGAGLSLRYALLRLSAHHYFHIGEIASKRISLGHNVGEFPGALEQCV